MYQQTIFVLLVSAVVGFVISTDHGNHTYYYMALPFSSMVAYYFLAGKNAWWEELLFLSILATVVLNH